MNESGFRDRTIVVVGGYPVNDEVKEYTGADYCTNDPNRVLSIFKEASERINKVRTC